ncbi:hypothetical protein OG601_21880 [Streptomyces sp. NBC_01239]|uniref:hypothetical protein n=1 Tax=Streptomyces sp. NBC_01239 TaxID=2903792 RepID=UPI002259AFF7|nr:hypothetical protein [Streptomyces sp. NBC_01239]MCX4813245.1 hypothetical protein [Streptomyces sp. NBC_01239]
MNWPAELSGAAVRVTRTAVGRRVFQLALLVGGLFALGFLCGGQAQAADGVTGQRPVIPAVASVAKPVPLAKQVPASVPVLAPVLAPVSDTVERVVRPVVDVVTKTVTEVVTKTPALPALPTLPSVPTIPIPSVPTLPSAPVVPGQPASPVPTPPAHTAPVPTPVPAPVRSAPQPSGAGQRADVRSAEVTAGVGDPYGPRFGTDTGDAVGAVGHGVVGHALSSSVGHAPVRHQAPAGDPDGALRNQSGVDSGSGSSRHCDAQAVTSEYRVAVRIVPGGVARVDAAETQDRYRDVPVFPG